MNDNTSKRRRFCIIMSAVFQLSVLLMMAFDQVPQGFGVSTLWIGPPLLMTGILFPVIGLTRFNLQTWTAAIKSQPVKTAGFFLSFGISWVVYIMTLEPTASLWDCSETIAACYKLQIPHTPGTPLTLLMGRLFSMMALGNVHRVAWFVNLMSALLSSLAVSFTFLITWHFGKSIIRSQWVLWIGSLGGALCLAFSDSFWFSAVEAETYGPSIFCMVWLIGLSIQGKNLQGRERDQWILLLSYLIGLSYCIHPMCILILPVCILIWRSKPGKESWKSILISFGSGVAIILFISKIIAVDLFEWAFRLDLLLVNHFSFPLYSGVFLLVILLSGLLIFIWKRYQKSRLILAAMLMILAGFSPYLMLFIRSSKLPPINEFSPHNLAKIKPYMNRESYPGRPLLYGPYFDAKIDQVSTKAHSYIVVKDLYQLVGDIPEYHYEKSRTTILPRMYSNDPDHINTYQKWTGLLPGEKPRFPDNLTFMFRYQMGHMYGRYLMWNFAGRASDVQHADWLAPWEGSIDRSYIGYSRAHNQYYLIPLLLGILGMIVQSNKDRMGFTANLAFFLITGLLLVIYLNATPNEPRERDYIYVGSYVAFSIWIGLGMMSAIQIVQNRKVSYFLGSIMLLIPVWMLYQNWDDHDRSGRTFQIDNARNLLNSCEKGAILFTGGDNDTFPLWYLQEVEGYRTDVRVKVLSYFNADWYINQLSRQYYDSPPFALTLHSGENQYGPYDPLYIHERVQSPISWNKYMTALKNRNPQLIVRNASGDEYFILPSRHINLNTSQGLLQMKVEGSYLPKSELAILDLIASNDWSRPVYFNFTALNSLSIDLKAYLNQEGLVYHLVPEKSSTEEVQVNHEKSYENLVHHANYENLSDPQVYFSHEDYQARMIFPIKFNFNLLINHYLTQEDLVKANELSTFVKEKLYFDHLEPSYADLQLAGLFDDLGRTEESKKLAKRTFLFFYEKIKMLLRNSETPARNDLIILQEARRLSKDPEVASKYQEMVEELKHD